MKATRTESDSMGKIEVKDSSGKAPVMNCLRASVTSTDAANRLETHLTALDQADLSRPDLAAR